MTANRCGICELEADPILLQMCFRCDTNFHLNPYNTTDGIDCGDAVVGEEMGVYYYCGPCLVAMNEEMSIVMAQQAQSASPGSGPGWRATPGDPMGMDPMAAMMGMMGMPPGMGPMDGMPPGAFGAPAPAPSSPPAARPAPKPAGSPPRRRFRRID